MAIHHKSSAILIVALFAMLSGAKYPSGKAP